MTIGSVAQTQSRSGRCRHEQRHPQRHSRRPSRRGQHHLHQQLHGHHRQRRHPQLERHRLHRPGRRDRHGRQHLERGHLRRRHQRRWRVLHRHLGQLRSSPAPAPARGSPPTQTLNVMNSTGTIMVNMVDNGIVNVDAATSASELPNYSTSVVFTIGSGGQLDTAGSAGVDYLRGVRQDHQQRHHDHRLGHSDPVLAGRRRHEQRHHQRQLRRPSRPRQHHLHQQLHGHHRQQRHRQLERPTSSTGAAETGAARRHPSGATFDDDTSAGGGSFTATSVNFDLTGTGTSPGIAAGSDAGTS